MQLYERITSPDGKVSYKPIKEESPQIVNMSDKEMLTVAGALGITLLMVYERVIPPHKRIARKIDAVKSAVCDLYAGAGEPVDEETIEYFCRAWDKTMRMMST